MSADPMPNATDAVPASFPTHFAGLVAAHPNEPALVHVAPEGFERWVPKSVEFVDEIPRRAATKVNRQAMIAERQVTA